jgi:hypothetical protein
METEDVVLIGSGQGESRVSTEERALLERLLRKDVAAFSALVDRHHGLMVPAVDGRTYAVRANCHGRDELNEQT